LSFVSQTPPTQTSFPAAAVHVPFSVGFVCGASVGTAVPLGSCAVQVVVLSSHQSPLMQSASASQPPMGSHTPLVLQAPERHTVVPFDAVHGPSPLA
jgi:hypothetical protein